MLTGLPITIDVVFRFKSLPDTPTSPSSTNTPLLSTSRYQVAVPVATALAPVIVLAVNTPLEAAGLDGSENVSSASNVVAVPPF